jgi:hypothetical protein
VIDATGPAVSDQYRIHAERRLGAGENGNGGPHRCVQISQFRERRAGLPGGLIG